jgi:hypothetical protein
MPPKPGCAPRAELRELAKGSPDPDIADRFRAIAADYFDLAEQLGGSEPVVQQQQQAQPDEGAK